MSNNIKIVLLGDTGVGKTSLLVRYVLGTTPQEIKSTIGASFLSKQVTIQNQTLELLIWDTAGQEIYRGLAPMYYRSALIAIIVYDVTNNESFKGVEYWINELRTNVEESIIILICGNKIDLNTRVIDYGVASEYAKQQNALFTEASAYTGTGVERIFQMAIKQLLQKLDTPAEESQIIITKTEEKTDKKDCC